MVSSTHLLLDIFNTPIKILGIVLIFNYKVLPTPNVYTVTRIQCELVKIVCTAKVCGWSL